MFLLFILRDHQNGNLWLTFDHFKGFHCQYACLNSLIWLVIGRSKKINMQLCSYNTISSFCGKHHLCSFCHYSGCIIAGKLDLRKTDCSFEFRTPKLGKNSWNIFGTKKKKFFVGQWTIFTSLSYCINSYPIIKLHFHI